MFLSAIDSECVVGVVRKKTRVTALLKLRPPGAALQFDRPSNYVILVSRVVHVAPGCMRFQVKIRWNYYYTRYTKSTYD